MKAKDLELNGEYLSNPAKGWESETFTGTGYRQVRRVRVLDVIPGSWVRDDKDHTWKRGSSYSYRTSQGVLVALLDAETGEFTGRNDVVSTASIRGPWESTWKQVQETARVEREAREAARDQMRKDCARVESALARLGELAGFHGGAYRYNDQKAIVSVEILELLVKRMGCGCHE